MIKPATNAREVNFPEDSLIVSKTDLKGQITYANRAFMKVSNFYEQELLGKPHNLIRHPDMPRGVYYGLWKSLKANREFFGFVKNITKDGHYYWVFANITPDLIDNKPVGFYSVRRNAPKEAVATIEDIYQQMHQIEKKASKDKAPQASWDWLVAHTKQHHNQSYDEFVLSLYHVYA